MDYTGRRPRVMNHEVALEVIFDSYISFVGQNFGCSFRGARGVVFQ